MILDLEQKLPIYYSLHIGGVYKMREPFNDLQQVELSIDAAQKMVGTATMSMEPGQLQAAEEAVQIAKNALNEIKKQNNDNDHNKFLEEQKSILNACTEQLKEAKR